MNAEQLPHKDCPAPVLEERINNLDKDVQELKQLSDMRVDVGKIKTLLEDHLIPKVEKHDKRIFGRNGLETQFDRLDIAERKRSRLLWIIVGAVIIVAIKQFVPVVTG